MVQIFLVKSGRCNLRGKTSHSHDLVLIDRISQDSVLITITRDISWSSTCDIPPTTDISWSTTCDITPNVRKEFAPPENLVRVGPSFYCANPRGFEISFTCRQGYLSRVFIIAMQCIGRVLTSAFHWAEWGQCGDICDARDDTKGGHWQCLLVIWRCSNVLTYDALEPSAGGRRCPLWIEHN